MVVARKSRKRVLKSARRTRVAKSRRLKRVKTRRRVHKRKMKKKRMSKRRRRGGVDSEGSPPYTNDPNQQVAPSYEVSQSLASEMVPIYEDPPPSYDKSQKVREEKLQAEVYSNKVSPADQKRYKENKKAAQKSLEIYAAQHTTPKTSFLSRMAQQARAASQFLRRKGN